MFLENLLIQDVNFFDNIEVANFLIVDKKMAIPSPIFYSQLKKEPIGALELLKKFRVYENKEKQKKKDNLLEYLNKIQFPANGVYERW